MMIDSREDDEARRSFQWKAALYAGLAVGALFLLIPRGGIPWASFGFPSHAMGRALFYHDQAYGFLVTGFVQIVLSVLYTIAIGAVSYRFRTLPSILSGLGLGLVLYGLNYAIFHFLFSNVPPAAESTVLLTHVAFGMMAAGAYKGFALPGPRVVTSQ